MTLRNLIKKSKELKEEVVALRNQRDNAQASGRLFDGKTLLQYRGDPDSYAKSVLGISLTPKQLEIIQSLESPPYRVLCRAGHIVGKCVDSDEKITLANGARIKAKNLVGRDFKLLTLSDG